ncbi:DNA primase large subunit Spp2 [Teratosphaeriaceae sp. CCFEE 6253]|nr:DNA primase large subunit Spp2 [Teratosphaeriaceae sp. CCFEE 6253]
MPEKISLALGGARKPSKPVATNGVKRSHASLRDEDDEGHDDGGAQTVSHFDKAAGGAIDEGNREHEEGPLIITPQANRDWKDAGKRKRQRTALPGGQGRQDLSAQVAAEARLEAAKPGFGLNVTQKASEEGEAAVDGHDAPSGDEQAAVQSTPNGDATAKHRTDDEAAMDALLGKTKKSDLVLPAVTEEEAFERDYHSAPDMATLDDYARVPVEQFGAALLRGMGWKEGQGIGSQKGVKIVKVKVPERRPALLGIGAKEEAAVAQEMGVWGKAAKRGGEVKVYNPVLLRDKQTGETFTEEELARKKEVDERRQYEEEFEAKEREREKKERRRERSRSRERDGDRRRKRDDEGHDSRDRRKDEERRSEKYRRQDGEKDEEYYHRKEEDRRRRERDREDDEQDRERGKRRDDRLGKHRDRSRDRRH